MPGMKHGCNMPRNVTESSRIREKSHHSKLQRNSGNKLSLQKCILFLYYQLLKLDRRPNKRFDFIFITISRMIFVTSWEGSLTFTSFRVGLNQGHVNKRVSHYCVFRKTLSMFRGWQSSQLSVKIFLIRSQEHSVPSSLWLLVYDVCWHRA